MIHEITITSAWRFGDALGSMHRLRRRDLADANKWDVPHWRDMEYDQYDALPTRYLVALDPAGEVVAVQRNLFCGGSYMLKDLWPELAPGADLPCTDKWAEGTRCVVARGLPVNVTRGLSAQLLLANIEWALHYGVEHYTFVTYEQVVPAMVAAGLPVELWGDPVQFPDGSVVAGHWAVSEELLAAARARTGMARPVLVPLDDNAAAAGEAGGVYGSAG